MEYLKDAGLARRMANIFDANESHSRNMLIYSKLRYDAKAIICSFYVARRRIAKSNLRMCEKKFWEKERKLNISCNSNMKMMESVRKIL